MGYVNLSAERSVERDSDLGKDMRIIAEAINAKVDGLAIRLIEGGKCFSAHDLLASKNAFVATMLGLLTED